MKFALPLLLLSIKHSHKIMLIALPKLPFLFFLFHIFFSHTTPTLVRHAHVINFRSPNLYPESLTWDPHAHHFLLGSLRHRTIVAVSDSGNVETFISDPALPSDVSFFGLAVDSPRHRVLAVVNRHDPPFNALAAYDLHSRRRLFLSTLPSFNDSPSAANDVAVDNHGDAFVTNSAGNFIWKVTADGDASIFSSSPLFTNNHDQNAPYGVLGLNGIAYVSNGYFLVVQSSTGKVFKVDEKDGTAKTVLLNEDLIGADDIAVRSDGVVLVVSPTNKLWFLRSQDNWAEGVVYDKVELDLRRFPTSVTVGAKERVYVLYGHLGEGRMKDSERESFGIAEVRSKKEGSDEKIWMFVLVGMGLAYFLFWKFQMSKLVNKMDHKIK
ncbi:putative six-bladed beta-propeller, TolB [Lupinus albus]|uniref:Putative six-bladed beta-propeller, TolB n=1 Tax=Lupinus albus TaxID=3870 RepID=A0A6A4NDF9_LUPAL|nr:putative six-bladed beta-propeller, TolB [Lupinus albus]